MCVHCESEQVFKRGTTGKDAQQYWYKDCETYFNDLTDTIFGQHRFELEELFYTIKVTSDYEAVLDFVHEVQDTSGDIGEFKLSEEWFEKLLCYNVSG